MATRDELLKIFETAGAIRHGHFELSSGLHSGTYVQCALALQYPRFAEKLGAALAARFVDARIEAVVSPALVGLIVGQEVARAFAGGFWRRGGRRSAGDFCGARWQRHDGAAAWIFTASGTTGVGGGRCLDHRRLNPRGDSRGAGSRRPVVATAALIDRSGGKIEFPVKSQALLDLPIASYDPNDCPLCREGSAAVKPGSRFVRSAS